MNLNDYPAAAKDLDLNRLKFWLDVMDGGQDSPGSESDDYDRLAPEKMSGDHIDFGDRVRIVWNLDCASKDDPEYEFDPIEDEGVVIALPFGNQDDVLCGGVVFIPRPWVEKQAPEMAWVTLIELVTNPACVEIQGLRGAMEDVRFGE